VLILFVSITNAFSQELSVQIIDTNTKQVLVGAHIINNDGDVVSITNNEGFFRLWVSENTFPIRITALGYHSKEIDALNGGEILELVPTILHSEEHIIISGESENTLNIRHYHKHSSEISTEEFLSKVDGMEMIQRGAFAWEPSVRGQSDQRLNVMIDGMAVFKACVDKMDPITSYVELNNLESLSVDKNGASVAKNGNGYAAINMQTEKATFKPSELEFESNYKAPNNQYLFRLKTNGSNPSNLYSYRIAASYRKADSFTAGNDVLIENSQFEKWNLNLSINRKLSDRLNIETNYITDKAYDVGYPALLMDATSALADIIRFQLNVKESDHPIILKSISIYSNRIRHTMDDYHRDVSTRVVMRDMNMPMYGETSTYGINTEGSWRIGKNRSKWYLNAFRSNAFGDMEMISTLPNIADMYIYNLDDVVTSNISLGFSQNFLLSRKVNLNLEQNIQLSRVHTQDQSYQALFEGLYRKSINERFSALPSVSASLLYMLDNDVSISFTSVYSSRTGNHIEQYGHYIYNYVDGFFYDGNPFLKNEHTFSSEIELTLEKPSASYTLSGFNRYFLNYIDGILIDNNQMGGLEFKQYANVGNALFLGGEFRSIHKFQNSYLLENRLSYVFAENTSLKEPIPLIPPLRGNSRLQGSFGSFESSLSIEWALKQERVAVQSTIEDETDGYALLHASLSKDWFDGTVNSFIHFNNITDQYYHTHTSIGNIPSEGLSVMAGIKISLK